MQLRTLGLLLGLLLGVGCNAGKATTSDPADTGRGGDAEGDPGTVREGPWRAASASIDGDPCGFDEYLSSFGYSTLFFLPSTFAVEPASSGFLIEATPYNVVRGPILCTLDGTRFSCEQQTVQVSDAAYIYEIDFSGEVVDDETVQGTAVVSFQLDEESESLIADAGFDMSDCDHSIDLELAYGRF